MNERNTNVREVEEDTTELLSDNVHCGEDGLFVVVVVHDVPEVEGANQDHGPGEVSELFVLLGGNAEVQEDPQDQTGASLAEQLKVEAGVMLVLSSQVLPPFLPSSTL